MYNSTKSKAVRAMSCIGNQAPVRGYCLYTQYETGTD